uniref:NADH dehydrogenase [ubiquinone] 1 alpha subcomplex assembly factor 4 n=1 Tax=Callorhinchus milii TaxID=7868 RepID=V9L2B4_CALMI
MGSRLTRALRNFNLESRAHGEISRPRPRAAPRHPASQRLAEQQQQQRQSGARQGEIDELTRKNENLVSLLKNVYVDSKDTPVEKHPIAKRTKPQQEMRHSKVTLKRDPFAVTNIPKGKLSIVEVLTILNNHKLDPKTWTSDKIAEEYSLEPKDVEGLLEFFKVFEIKILPPEEKKERIGAR